MQRLRTSMLISLGMVLLILIAVTCTTLGEWPLLHRDSTMIIPLQKRFEVPAEVQYDDDVIARLAALSLPGSVPSRQVTEELEALMKTALLRQDMYFSRRWIMTVSGQIAELIRHKMNAQLDDEAWSICLRLRWILPRINQLAEPCSNIKRRSGSLQRNGLEYVRSGQYFQVLNPSRKIAAAGQHYLNDPYDADALFDLAIQLASNGLGEHADLLQEELMQIDPASAAKLENRITELQQ